MPRLGLKSYFQQKLEELDVILREKEQNVRRLEAQRNDWNEKGVSRVFIALENWQSYLRIAFTNLLLDYYFLLVRFIKEELMKLQEPGSQVGEVVKLMGKTRALVKVVFL